MLFIVTIEALIPSMSYQTICFISALVLAALICIGETNHVPSPHRFNCPPKNAPGGLGELTRCAAKLKFLLDQFCKPNRGFPSKLLMNLVKHVFFHAIKCVDEDMEHFVVDGAVDCFLDEKKAGSKMLCNIKKSACNLGMQSQVIGCVAKEIQLHKVDYAKLMSQSGHLGLLCNLLADGTHRECKAYWKDFPPFLIK